VRAAANDSAAGDQTLWAKSYDGTWHDVLRLQSEIAARPIARAEIPALL